MRITILFFLLFGLLGSEWYAGDLSAQATDNEVRGVHFSTPKTAAWFNTYGDIRLSNRFSWIAQTHFRFLQSAERPFIGQIAQVYNRHALSYRYSPNFRASLGGVLRLNFNTDGVKPGEQRTVPEWRIWHEYLFSQYFTRMKVYHRIRIEHRWSRAFGEESDYFFRNRWRYMIGMKMPLNSRKLDPGTVYVAPEAELILQSGKVVVDSPLEDLRLTTTLGYVLNPEVTCAAGLMYSMGQSLYDGSLIKRKWTARFHVYFRPDLRKKLAMVAADH